MLRETSQEAHSHISSICDIQRVNEQELTAVPEFYQPLGQERFTAWGCIRNHPYGDKSILRKERRMCSYGLLWLRHKSGHQKKSIMVLLCELWQFVKPFPALSIFWAWYFLFSRVFMPVKGSGILRWEVLQKHGFAMFFWMGKKGLKCILVFYRAETWLRRNIHFLGEA